LNSTVGLLNFISPDTFNRGTGVRPLGRSEPIHDGALQIWGRLATSLNSLAGPWPKLVLKGLTHDEAQRIAANIAKLPGFLYMRTP